METHSSFFSLDRRFSPKLILFEAPTHSGHIAPSELTNENHSYLKPEPLSRLSSLSFKISGNFSGSTGETGTCNGSAVVDDFSDQSNEVIDRRSVDRVFDGRFNDPIGMNSSDR